MVKMQPPHSNRACIMIETFADTAPAGQELTAYDKAHVKLYARLLDADADGADWTEAVQILFRTRSRQRTRTLSTHPR